MRFRFREGESLGYRVTMTIINVTFALVLIPVIAILGGPLFYEMGL